MSADIQTQKTPLEQLISKVNKEFRACTYLGDIPIDDEEYRILIQYLSSVCSRYANNREVYVTSPTVAVALIQIAKRCALEQYWETLADELQIELTDETKEWIEKSLCKTLTDNGKYCAGEGDMEKNVLLHSNITAFTDNYGCFLADKNCNISEDRPNGLIIFKGEIIGLTDCAADIYFNDVLIAEKAPVTTGGIKLRLPFLSGAYRIDYFEIIEDEETGEKTYHPFDSVVCRYVNKYDITEKTIYLLGATEKKREQMIFKPDVFVFGTAPTVTDIRFAEGSNELYEGTLHLADDVDLPVQVEFLEDNNFRQAYVSFYSEEEECYMDFLYDKKANRIVPTEDESLSATQARLRYILLLPDDYYFNTQVK